MYLLVKYYQGIKLFFIDQIRLYQQQIFFNHLRYHSTWVMSLLCLYIIYEQVCYTMKPCLFKFYSCLYLFKWGFLSSLVLILLPANHCLIKFIFHNVDWYNKISKFLIKNMHNIFFTILIKQMMIYVQKQLFIFFKHI